MEPETLKALPTEIMGLLAKLQAVEQTLVAINDLNSFIDHNQRETTNV